MLIIKNEISLFADMNFLLGKNEATKTDVFIFKGVEEKKEVKHIVVVTPADSSEVIACYVLDGGISSRRLFKYLTGVLRKYGIWDKAVKDSLSYTAYERYLFEHNFFVDISLTETFDVDRTPAMKPELRVTGVTEQGAEAEAHIEVTKIEKY